MMRRVEPRASTLFCFALFFLLSASSFGVYLNDEGAQLQGLHNLRHGSFEMKERPPQFYATREGHFIGDVNGTQRANPFVSAIALPAYGALSLVNSVPKALLLVWGVAGYVTLDRVSQHLYWMRTGCRWSWSRGGGSASGLGARLLDRRPSYWLLPGGMVAAVLIQWGRVPRIVYGVWGEVFAVQVTNMVLSAWGFALFWKLVRKETGSLRVTSLAAASMLMGPFALWGVGIKYHAGSMVLTVASLYLCQKSGRWRLAALPVAALGAAVTPLGVPIAVAVVAVEVVGSVRAGMRGEGTRAAMVAVGVTAGGLALVGAFAGAVDGNRLSEVVAAMGGAGSPVSWLASMLRFEGWDRSALNLWRVFVDSSLIPGGPVSVFALSPLTALAFFAPVSLRGRWTHTRAVAALGAGLFVLAFVHAAHTHGDGHDNRFFSTVLPALLMLGSVVIAPHVVRVRARAWKPGVYGMGAWAVVLAAVMVLASMRWELVPGAAWRQLLRMAWLLGTASWVGTAGLIALGRLWPRRFGVGVTGEVWVLAAGLMPISGALWLSNELLLWRRVLPTWPFGSGAEGMSFLLPGMEAVRSWWLSASLP